MMPREILSECEALALAVAPELGRFPLYICNAPAGGLQTSAARCLAYTPVNGIDLPLRDSLIAEDRWRGPGTAIVFCEAVSRETALALCLHETAHALPVREPAPDVVDDSPELRMLQRESVAAGQRVAGKRPPWFGSHDLAWIRNCLHLHWRSWQRGYEIGAREICFAGRGYGLSSHWQYLHALGDEPARMKDQTFAEIAAAPYPREFLELWRDDIGDWYRRKPDFFSGGKRMTAEVEARIKTLTEKKCKADAAARDLSSAIEAACYGQGVAPLEVLKEQHGKHVRAALECARELEQLTGAE